MIINENGEPVNSTGPQPVIDVFTHNGPPGLVITERSEPCNDAMCPNHTVNGHYAHAVIPVSPPADLSVPPWRTLCTCGELHQGPDMTEGMDWLIAHQREKHPEMFEPVKPQPRCAPDEMIYFLDHELRRLRWELAKVITAVSEVNPDSVCRNQRCPSLELGRMFPHIRTRECRG